MGWYINPRNMTKEEWLEEHSKFGQYHAPLVHYEPDDDLVAVCLVQNPGFTAAAIAVDAHELLSFTQDPDDTRPKLWYHVPREKLIPFLYGKQIEGAPVYGTVSEEGKQSGTDSETTVQDSGGDTPSVA